MAIICYLLSPTWLFPTMGLKSIWNSISIGLSPKWMNFESLSTRISSLFALESKMMLPSAFWLKTNLIWWRKGPFAPIKFTRISTKMDGSSLPLKMALWSIALISSSILNYNFFFRFVDFTADTLVAHEFNFYQNKLNFSEAGTIIRYYD